MRYLLDTHTFLWWVFDIPKLGPRAREIMASPSSELLLSAVSAWEISIKWSLGRLQLAKPPAEFVPQQMAANNISPLVVEVAHTLKVAELQRHHRDPFDRMLAAQALVEGLPILSSDDILTKYGVEVIS